MKSGSMNPAVGIIAVSLVGLSAFAGTVAEVDIVESIYELEALFVENQYRYLPVSPPMPEIFVQPQNSVVPADWKKFPKDFTKQLYAEMREINGSLFPTYTILAYEDPVTRETVFSGSYGEIGPNR